MDTANADHCPFCRGTSLRPFSRAAHDALPGGLREVGLVECRDCVAAWQFPVVRDASSSRDAFDAAYMAGEGSFFEPTRRLAVAQMQRQFIEARMPAGSVLDIGCGDGCFAHTMAEAGWRATGLDPAMPEKALDTSSTVGLRLIRGTLNDLLDEDNFDLITLWDVVEHLDHPAPLLQAVASRLKPGGSLIIETGNYQSSGRIEGDNTWWNYQLDHRWYFAPPQLEALVRDFGLEPVEWSPRVLRPWWRGQAASKAPELGSVVKSLARGPQAFGRARQRYQELAAAHRDWPHWGGLEIITLRAQSPS